MGAPVKRRVGYHEECATIQRIHRRISEDETRDPAWRAEMLKHLDHVVAGFNEDSRRTLLRSKSGDEKEPDSDVSEPGQKASSQKATETSQ